MENILEKFTSFLTDKLGLNDPLTKVFSDAVDSGKDFEINTKGKLRLPQLRAKVCFAINTRIFLISELQDAIKEHEENTKMVKEMERAFNSFRDRNNIPGRIADVEKERELYELLQIAIEDIKSDTIRIQKDKELLLKFDNTNTSISKLNKLLKFIESDCGYLLSEKHLKTFYNIPDLTEKEKYNFECFVEAYNKIINDKNSLLEQEKEKIAAIREEKRRLEQSNKIEKMEQKDLSVERNSGLVMQEGLQLFEEEVEEVPIYIPCEKSTILFNNFLIGNEFESIKLLFPKLTDPLYYIIKNDLIMLLEEQIDSFYKELEKNEGNTKLVASINQFEDILELVSEYFEHEETIENSQIKSDKNAQLFFATSEYQKNYLLDDIKNFETRELKIVFKMIEKLKAEQFTMNPTQQKKLTNHRHLKGVFELKRQGIRLVYKDIGFNNYYVLMAFKKSSMRDSEVTKSIVNRNRINMQHFNNIQRNLGNKDFMDYSLKTEQEITEILKKSLIEGRNF